MNIIFDYNRTLFDPEANRLYDGVPPLLSCLSTRHRLFLISRDETGRAERLRSLNIAQFFEQVFFVPNKTLKLFRKITASGQKTLVIGDYVSEEIRFGNELGCITVWLRRGKFADRLPLSPLEFPTHTIRSLNELSPLLSSYE